MMDTFLRKINPFLTIEQAATVPEAIEKLNGEKFDALVSDRNLPDFVAP